MASPWEEFQSGDTATATAPAEDQGPWSDFEPGVADPVQAPGLSKIKLSPYDQATVDRGGIKPPSGMESGTELTTALAGGAARALAAVPPTIRSIADFPTTVARGISMGQGHYADMPPVGEEREAQSEGFGAAMQKPIISLDLLKAKPEPDDPAWAAAIKEAESMLVSIPEFIESPLGILTMGTGMGGKAATNLARYAFAGDMVKSMFEQAPQLRDNWGQMTPSDKGKAITQFLGTGAMAGLLMHPEARGTVKDPLANVADRTSQLAPDPIRLSPGGRPVFGAEAKPLPTELLTAPAGAMATQPTPQPTPPAGSPDMGETLSGRNAMRPTAAARAPDPPVVPPKAEATAVAPVAESGKADPNDFVPALKPKEGEIIPGQKGNIHDDIYKAQGEIPGLELKVSQPEHGFLYQGKFLSREEASKLLGEKEPLQSERLNELQKATPEPAAAPESVKGGAESGLSPEAQAKSRANNSLRKMAEANGVDFVEGDTPKTVLAKINAKSSQPAAAPTAPPAEPDVLQPGIDAGLLTREGIPTPPAAGLKPGEASLLAQIQPPTPPIPKGALDRLRRRVDWARQEGMLEPSDPTAPPSGFATAPPAEPVIRESRTTPAPEATPSAKKPWQMTKEEWAKTPLYARYEAGGPASGAYITDLTKEEAGPNGITHAELNKRNAGSKRKVAPLPEYGTPEGHRLRVSDAKALAAAPSPFKAGDVVDHQGQTKTIKRMSPDGKFAVIGNRAIPVSEIKPAAPEKGMAGPGTPSAVQGPDVGGGFQNQSGADIYGIAQRVREQRAKAGQVAPIPTGQGVAAGEAVKWGQDLISMGVDPEKSMQEFERTRAVSFDLMAMGRGHGESLAKTARSIEGKFGTDSNEYRMAQKALTDWDTRSKAMQTEWHKIGMAQQGETDIDTGSFTGISRAFKDATGQDFTPGQKQRATKIAAEVSSADKAAQAAKPNLQAKIDKIGAPVEPRVQRLAEKIIAAMDKKANDALARIKARQAQGRAFSVGDPEDFDDVIIYGAAKITKGVVEFGVWSKEMLAEIGKGIEPHLRKIFDAATKYEDDETTRLAGGKVNQQKVKSASKTPKVPTGIAEQKKAFQDYKPGAPMDPGQLKTLWTRAMEYIKPDGNDMADVVYKVSEDLGLPSKDVLKGLNQSRSVKRVADDVWQKQRQARILKQSAKQWIEHAQETWLARSYPAAARALFSAKVGLHGTVALGTHASLVAATHPIIFAENFGKMYKLVASPEYYQMQGKAIARRPNYNTAQRAGLVNDMAKMEDFNDPRLALQHPKLSAWFKKNLDKVHLGRLVGMGTRGYSVLKVLRQDLFDHEWDKLAESKQTPDMAKAISDSVNHITGVDAAKLPSVANYALFAPKLLLSRVKVIAGDPLRAANSLLKMRDMTPAEKWFATNQFKDKAKIFGTATGLLIANQQLNSLFGDDKKLNGVPAALGGAGYNPMASDFMKFRVAGMNVAWGSPFLTMSRLPLRLIQIGMGNGGKSRFLIYPDESMYKTAGSYLRTQESPFMAPIVSMLTKADWQDRPLPQIPGYGPPPPMPKRLAAQGIKPYTWLEFGSEILMPIPVEEGVNEMWHYGLGSTPEQKAAMRKSFAVTLLMAATGGRIAEDWSKPAASAASPPPWEQFR